VQLGIDRKLAAIADDIEAQAQKLINYALKNLQK